MVSSVWKPVRRQSLPLLSGKNLLSRIERLKWLRLRSAESKNAADEQRHCTHSDRSDQQGQPESNCGEQESDRHDEEHSTDQRIAHAESEDPDMHGEPGALSLPAGLRGPSSRDPLVELRHKGRHRN